MQNLNYPQGRKQLCEKEIIAIPPGCRERFLSLTAPHLLPLLEAGIRFSGTAVLGRGYRIKRFDPQWHSLIYTFEGSGRLQTGGREHILHPGALYIAPAHDPHEYWIDERPWKIGWFCMEEQNGFRCMPSKPLVLTSASFSLVSSILQQLTDAPEGTQPEILRDAVHLLLTILRHDTKSTLASRERQQQRRLDSAFLAVHRDPSFDWTVPALVEQGHLPFGEDRLRQLCIAVYDQTPMKRVRAIRMEIAKELLRATDYPLRIIAPMVGYRNEFAFSTTFRKETGRSPQDFRTAE